ncbi:MAG: hypothetical protein N2606_03855 [Candidatus Omnitrophica bacterium]|nr:hypothetical protein [Candidatus Omnitrophota bacterium]
MAKNFVVGIMGCGRIAQAVKFYLDRNKIIKKVFFICKDSQAKYCDLLIGALPSALGQKCLRLALFYKKHLIDISDIDPPFYLKHRDKINKSDIMVIPGCGFSPGLVNCILGREFNKHPQIEEVEVKAGSLSPRRFYYPFLWCFEDIVAEHGLSSWQVVGAKKKLFPAFGGYQPERFFGIDAESYYVASGFENILDKFKLKNCTVRVVRPKGFREFFLFLKNYGLLSGKNLFYTKFLLERKMFTNITFAEIIFKNSKITWRWLIKAKSSAKEKLNSMQKITASVPAVVAELFLRGDINKRGLLFMEDLGQDKIFFSQLLQGVREKKIIVKND